MDGDFQLQYQAAERAYGAGDYPEARRLAGDLLNQLGDQPKDPTPDHVLGWRAFVALLLGHIDLHAGESRQCGRFLPTGAGQSAREYGGTGATGSGTLPARHHSSGTLCGKQPFTKQQFNKQPCIPT